MLTHLHIRSVVGVTLLALATMGHAAPRAIPPLTPNVVDEVQALTPEEVVEVNQALQVVRERADIWGAVLIVDKLGDESIEALAERAFREWQLGEKGKDNGLLLVLATEDRRSRFEVGYGLEGDLPDVYTRRALDNVLRPYMREGDVKTAIIKSFTYLAGIKSKDPVFEADVEAVPTSSKSGRSNSDIDPKGGFVALIIFYICLWFLRPIAQAMAIGRARKLAETHPSYRIDADKRVNHGRFEFRDLFFGGSIRGALLLRLFFSINPGAFIFIGGGLHPLGAAGIGLLCAIIGFFYIRAQTSRYASVMAYETFVAAARKRNQSMVEKGYMKETAAGEFEHTPAWFASAEYKASRRSSSSSSSSRSSSSSSSSSGGGRSGGGGSSSSW